MSRRFGIVLARIPIFPLAVLITVGLFPLGCVATLDGGYGETMVVQGDSDARRRRPRVSSTKRPTDRASRSGSQDTTRPTLKLSTSADRPAIRKPGTLQSDVGQPSAAQQKIIQDLRADVAQKNKQISSLESRVKALGSGAGDGDAAAQIQVLVEERDAAKEALDASTAELEANRASHDQKILDLEGRINELSGSEGGVDVAKLIEERDTAVRERDDIVDELDAMQMIKGQMESDIQELSEEKSEWDERLGAVQTGKEAVEQELADFKGERDGIVKERDDLAVQVNQLQGDLDLAKKASSQADDATKSGLKALQSEFGKFKTEVTPKSVKRATSVGLLGFLVGIGALGFAVFLFFTIRGLRQHIDMVQAHSAGALDPAEIEEIIGARVADMAADMGTMGAGGSEIEGLVGTNVKKTLKKELKSEGFQNFVKQIVAQSGGGGGGGEGGGLNPGEVKVMVDNQFRAITTYLKNEAVPKMVEDILRKKK
ncbi:MAG: hypothetical protein O7H41_03900 [Planctomycetota bacterium]|nr:hypothetical protein [Planctomycetota bacterium]